MAQKRFKNWKEAVTSFELGDILNGITPPGRYTGWDTLFNPGGGAPHVNVEFRHTATGATKTIENGSVKTDVAIVRLPNGTVVHEDEPHTGLHVTSNLGNAFDRIDLLVADHTFTPVLGGTAVTYFILAGAAGGPVTPPLPAPDTQVILGTLLVTASTDNFAGIAYAPANTPMMGGESYDSFIAKLALQTVSQAASDHAGLQAQIDVTAFPDTLYWDPTGVKTPVLFIDTPGTLIEATIPANFRDDVTMHGQLLFENLVGVAGVIDADVNDDLRIQSLSNNISMYGSMKHINPLVQTTWVISNVTVDVWAADLLGGTSPTEVNLPLAPHDRLLYATTGGNGANGVQLYVETGIGTGLFHLLSRGGGNSGYDSGFIILPANLRYRILNEFVGGSGSCTFFIYKFGL